MNPTAYFLLRRLHSLVGVFPLGIFLFMHLLTNSSAIFGAAFFEENVAKLHALGPALPIVEIVVIFVPLAIHIGLGIVIALQYKREKDLTYKRNWAFTFQRWSGWVALVFIAYHVIHLRFLHDMDAVPFSVVLADMMKNPLIFAAYLIGGISVIFHFANGLCTFCMTWGITVGPESQRYMGYAAIGVGGVLTAMLITSMASFASMQLSPEDIEALRAIHGN